MGRVYRKRPVGVKKRVLAIPPGGCVGIADVSAGPVARPTRSVVPTSSVLRDVAADRALVADLRRSNQFRALRQKAILLPDDGVLDHLGKRSHGADLDAVAGGAH